MSPRAYIIVHLFHHKHSDDPEKDPHPGSLWKSFIEAAFPITKKTFLALEKARNGKSEAAELFKNRKFPKWHWFERIADSKVSAVFFGALYLFLYIKFAPTLWLLPLILLTIFSVAIQGAYINFYGHKKTNASYRNYETNDLSQNISKKDRLGAGEGYHNNHHGEPWNPNFARKPGEVDRTYKVLCFLVKIGIFKWNKNAIVEQA
jgi:stearoyl-CoA desaturase (delta-9 desaturase)